MEITKEILDRVRIVKHKGRWGQFSEPVDHYQFPCGDVRLTEYEKKGEFMGYGFIEYETPIIVRLTKKEAFREHLSECKTCPVILGKSKRKKNFSYDEVVKLFYHKIPAESHHETLVSSGESLFYYNDVLAFHNNYGQIIGNLDQNWGRGFTSPPQIDKVVCWVSLNTLRGLLTDSYTWDKRFIEFIESEGVDALLVYHDDDEKNYYILHGHDEGNDFYALVEPCRTVKEAKKQLIPEVLRDKEAGKDYVRQGEWFFVPTKGLKIDKEYILKPLTNEKDRIIMNQVIDLNNHIPRDFTWDRMISCQKEYRDLYCTSPPTCLVRGTVRHLERDHKMINLGETWYIVFRSPIRQVRSIRGGD